MDDARKMAVNAFWVAQTEEEVAYARRTSTAALRASLHPPLDQFKSKPKMHKVSPRKPPYNLRLTRKSRPRWSGKMQTIQQWWMGRMTLRQPRIAHWPTPYHGTLLTRGNCSRMWPIVEGQKSKAPQQAEASTQTRPVMQLQEVKAKVEIRPIAFILEFRPTASFAKDI